MIALSAPVHAQVLPNDAVVEGKPLSEWTGEFFRWLYSIPTNQNPVFDYDGSRAMANQPAGDLFFLTSVYGFTSVATRRFTIPEDTYLFFPILAVDFENIDTFPPLTVEQLREAARKLIDTVSELHASIDGSAVPNLWDHRLASPVITLEFATADNLKTYGYGHPIVGVIDPDVGDGYWLMIEPLAVGTHVINFGGQFAGLETFRTDITDIITVVPVPLSRRIEQIIASVHAANLASNRVQPLLASLNAAKASFDSENRGAGINQLRAFQNKLRAQVAPNDAVLADQLSAAAQQIIDRAAAQLQ